MCLIGDCVSRMDRTNWSIRALLYSHNQHERFILGKMIPNLSLLNYNSITV